MFPELLKKKLKLKEGHVIDRLVIRTDKEYFAVSLRLPLMKDAARVRKCINAILGREENVRFFRTVTETGQEDFMSETLRKIKKRRALFAVGETNRKIILIAALIRGDFKVDEHVAEFVIGILPEYRGHGIGSKVAAALFAVAPEFGISVVRSSYNIDDSGVRDFYRKQGFEEAGRMPFARRVRGKLHDEVFVVKRLQ